MRALPQKRFSVKVNVTLADGRTVTLTKSYKVCGKAKKKAKR